MAKVKSRVSVPHSVWMASIVRWFLMTLHFTATRFITDGHSVTASGIDLLITTVEINIPVISGAIKQII